MSNNKDMKKELHKLCDSFFQSEDEEKLLKELKDNLEKFFKVINDKYGKNFNLNDDANKFLKEFSPWHEGAGGKLIEDFVKIVNQNSNKDFSWLDILEKDEQWKKSWEKSNKEVKIKEEVTDKNKHVNMRYQIPTHFHGDIDNAVIFHCMENPRGYLGDWKDNKIDKEFAGVSLEEFYIKSAIKREEESETIKDIIEERYQLTESENEEDFKEKITEIIYNSKRSPLARELNIMFYKFEDSDYKTYDFSKGSSDLEDYYYFKNYYKQLILEKDNNLEPFKVKENQDKALEYANKICNLEIYPFSCSQPSLDKNGIGKKILENSELSRLSAYIVLRRIYKYLCKCEQSKIKNEEEPQKPVFIFRKYDRAWEKLFKAIFEEVKKEKNNYGFDNKNTLNILEKLFFYRQTGNVGGGITSGNVISIKNYIIYQNIFQNLKETAFEEIFDVLHRGDADKKSSGKSGD